MTEAAELIVTSVTYSSPLQLSVSGRREVELRRLKPEASTSNNRAGAQPGIRTTTLIKHGPVVV